MLCNTIKYLIVQYRRVPSRSDRLQPSELGLFTSTCVCRSWAMSTSTCEKPGTQQDPGQWCIKTAIQTDKTPDLESWNLESCWFAKQYSCVVYQYLILSFKYISDRGFCMRLILCIRCGVISLCVSVWHMKSRSNATSPKVYTTAGLSMIRLDCNS